MLDFIPVWTPVAVTTAFVATYLTLVNISNLLHGRWHNFFAPKAADYPNKPTITKRVSPQRKGLGNSYARAMLKTHTPTNVTDKLNTKNYQVNRDHKTIAKDLIHRLDGLNLALLANRIADVGQREQDGTLYCIEKLTALITKHTEENATYTWASYFAEKNLFEAMGAMIMNLKENLPTKWTDAIRAHVRKVANAFAEYSTMHKKTLDEYGA